MEITNKEQHLKELYEKWQRIVQFFGGDKRGEHLDVFHTYCNSILTEMYDELELMDYYDKYDHFDASHDWLDRIEEFVEFIDAAESFYMEKTYESEKTLHNK